MGMIVKKHVVYDAEIHIVLAWQLVSFFLPHSWWNTALSMQLCLKRQNRSNDGARCESLNKATRLLVETEYRREACLAIFSVYCYV